MRGGWTAVILVALAACGTAKGTGGTADASAGDVDAAVDVGGTDAAGGTDASASEVSAGTDAGFADVTADAADAGTADVADAGSDVGTADAKDAVAEAGTSDAGPADAVADAGFADVAGDAVDAGPADVGKDAGKDVSVGPDQCTAEQACSGGKLCFAPGQSIGCGICNNAPATCKTDADCPADVKGICVPVPCACDGAATMCQPGCKANSECAEGQFCAGNGHCTPVACKQVGPDPACPTDFVCDEPDDPHCVRQPCTASSQCQGVCVNGLCYGAPGMCSYPPP